ncbi:MAG: hypothetical protein IKY89_00085 [Alistipes sp.]|nr:hypothetical protein [Alistipes sp.]
MRRVMFLLFCLGTINLYAQVPELEPTSVVDTPYTDLQVCDRVAMKAYEALSDVEIALLCFVEEDPVLSHFYSGNCSWYCGGQIDSVTASSALADRYAAENAHDFSIVTAWVEGVEGNGEGEYLRYSFPGTCPRITTVLIHNGYVKNWEVWYDNARVKRLLMYYNDEPYAILNLQDTMGLQSFDVGILGHEERSDASPAWSIKFEILEVYPGKKYEDTAITEIYFDGIDVH